MRIMKMKSFLGLLAVVGLMAGGVRPAQALLTAVKGQIELLVERATPGAFGEDITVGTIFTARLEAVSADGSVFPQNGEARTEVTDFFLQIGDTFWDETMKPFPQGGPSRGEEKIPDGTFGKELNCRMTDFRRLHHGNT